MKNFQLVVLSLSYNMVVTITILHVESYEYAILVSLSALEHGKNQKLVGLAGNTGRAMEVVESCTKMILLLSLQTGFHW